MSSSSSDTAAEARNLAAVQALFEAFAAGRQGYGHFVADDCVYESGGFPVLRGRTEILGFLFGGGLARVADAYGNPRLLEIRRLEPEIIHLVARGPVVFSERVDHHFTADGDEVLTTRLVGVMEFDDRGKCTAWREYHDPAFFTGRRATTWGDEQTALAP
jgi:limonene-1,2-epoxide hydrolase